MQEIKITVHRKKTKDPSDAQGIQRFHEERARLIQGLVDSLVLSVRGGVHDTDEDCRPREVAEVIIALGSAGVFTAMVAAFKHWLDRNKIEEIEIEAGGAKVRMKDATARDAQAIAEALQLSVS